MGKTIKTRIRALSEEYLNEVSKKFKEIGFSLSNQFLNEQLLMIEVKDYPEIISQLEDFRYFSRGDQKEWWFQDVTKQGITIYVVHRNAGDGYIFIPFNNVIAIHIIEEKFLINVGLKSN